MTFMTRPKHRGSIFLCLSLALLVGSSLVADQVPLFGPAPTLSDPVPLIEVQVDAGRWNLSVGPLRDSASHLVFDSVASLLQRWPNTRYRNGHNVVPGIVPIGTLLYHGRETREIPKGPEWIALDPELSRGFCIGLASSGCWHLTFVSTRPLRVLYFDGSSGAKMAGGSLDTQDYVAWNASHPEWVLNERKRIKDLCDWGRKYRLDGFYRMAPGYEMMLCDFTSGVQPVSFVQLNPESEPWHLDLTTSSEITLTGRPVPPQPDLSLEYKVLDAGTWFNFYPGEGRIKIDLTHLISFYDTDMFPSLVPIRSGLDRLQHRVAGVSDEDVKIFHERLDEVLHDHRDESSISSIETSGSGIDWRTLFQVIVDRYADRLEVLQYILNATDPTSDNYSQKHTQTMDNAMYRLQLMLTSYALRTARPGTADSDMDDSHLWASPVYQHCATTHTSALDPLKSSFTKSEHLLLNALEDTNQEICRIVVRLWAEGIEAGIKPGLPLQITRDEQAWLPLLQRWRDDVNSLMKWLGWSIWLKCRPACGMEEVCYMPTWPWFKKTPWPTESPIYEFIDDSDEEEWRNPLPRCIRRLDPFDWQNPLRPDIRLD